MAEKFRFGYIGIVGRANAGKSSLMNSFLGEKIAIVSSKPQTTRNNILGIYTTEFSQLIFVDTPGIHRSANHLDKFMMKNVRSAIEGVDVVLYLIDSSKPIDEEEKKYIQKLKDEEKSIVTVLTKCDKKQVCDFDADVKISIYNEESLRKLLDLILGKLTPSDNKNFLYAEDELTDKSVKFIVAEYIREASLNLLSEEIPHGIMVDITSFEENPGVVKISADIICERETHKGIVIGKRGEMLKKIGKQAREDAEKLLESKVFLSLFVKVEENWRNRPDKFNSLGY